ncbi:MAG: ATP-binding protein [Spirochaetales bacterium]|nr:ATP-binding protein [Spirochaetales bacterium]
MATAEQLKSLIQSHFEHDIERFNTIALQVAAHEAKVGHTNLAFEIRNLVDKSREEKARVIPFQGELNDLVIAGTTQFRIPDLIITEALKNRIKRVLTEYKKQEKLKKHGLSHRRKILLCGPPGTGKTMTAKVIAGELQLTVFIILMDKLVTKYMGETSAKLRQVFKFIENRKGVYIFDEFDAIGAERGRDNDVGEMRRVLNSFLQFIEQDNSDSIIVAATNNVTILDNALFRRFDDVLHYELPGDNEIKDLITNRLGNFILSNKKIEKAVQSARSLSHAEICGACDDAIKEAILNDKNDVSEKNLISMIEERKDAYGKRS